MKAVTWHGRRDVRVEEVPDPILKEPNDAIVKITSSGLCGSDLHLYETLKPFMGEGDVLGHEPMGIVEEVGSGVGLVAPAGTPAPIVDALHSATAEILATEGFKARMAAIGVDLVGTTPAEYAKVIRDDYDKWGKVVQAAGIKPE